jgi:hypothetical protein
MLPAIPNPSGGATIPAQAEAAFPDIFITQFVLDVTPSQAYIDACIALAAVPAGQDTAAAQATVAAALAEDSDDQFIAVRYRLFNYASQTFPTAAQLTALGLADDNLFKIANPWGLITQYPNLATVAGGIIANVPLLMALSAAQAQAAAAQTAATAATSRLAADQNSLASAQSQLPTIEAKLTTDQATLAAAQAVITALPSGTSPTPAQSQAVTAAQAAVTADEGTITTLQSMITLLPAQITTDQANVASTAAALTAANATVTSIQQQLGVT